MKKKLFILFFLAAHCAINAQTTTWTINGNNVTSDAKIGTNTSFDLVLETANTERFRITDDGKIGIGLSSPLHKFDLLGNMRVQGSLYLSEMENVDAGFDFMALDENGKVVKLLDSDVFQAIYKDDCKVIPGQPFPLPSWQSSSTTEFGILHTGSSCVARVGIGTNSPLTTLHVNGGGIVNKIHIGNTSFYDSNLPFQVVANNQTSFSTFKINNDGAVDILSAATNGNVFNISSISGLVYRIRHDGGIDMRYTGSEIAFSIVGSEENDIFLVDAGGGVYCRSLHVKNGNFWGDFVFEKNYPLMSLPDLEEYINNNCHLPEIPSASEVEQEGIDVYEMTRLLTIKVEELTLYMIEANKRIEELEAQLKH